jgi:hypothetical protein
MGQSFKFKIFVNSGLIWPNQKLLSKIKIEILYTYTILTLGI